MGSRHVASESISSAIAGPSVANKRRTAGQQLAPGQKTATAGGDPKMFGLGLAHQQASMQFAATPSSRPSSPANSTSYGSRPSSPSDGDCSSTSQHEVERGSSSYRYRSAPSSSQNTPSRRKSTSSSVRNHETSTWQPFSQSSWTHEKPKIPTLRTEDALSMDVLFQTHESPYRIQSAHPNLYRSPSSSSSFYRSDSMPMIASTSQSSTSTYESTLSPSASFSTLTPSKASLDPRRSSDTTLSIAPSPPMPSSSFQPHHLSSPNSLTNRTSPKSGPYKRGDSLTSACMPISSSTSSFFASARPRPSVDLASDKSEESRQMSNNKHEQKRRRRWNTLSWKARKRSPSDDGETALGYMSQHTACRLCLAIASACLGPLYSTIFPDHSTRQHQKQISSQSRHGQVPTRKRWQSQAFRGLLGLYIFYSLFLFTSRLYAIPLSSKGLKITKRGHVDARPVASEYNSWQQARFKLLDVYNVAADAIGSTALRLGRQTSKAAAGDFAGDSHGANSLNNLMLLDQLPEIRRQWGETNYRFSKMFSKTDASVYEQIEPFVFQAELSGQGGDITACLYYNDAWISQLPDFLERWRGPVSIVYELAEDKTSVERASLIKRLQGLREQYPLIRAYADIHVMYNSPQTDLQARRLRERLILRPVGSNLQLNLARFFAKTDMVWLVSDARILPAPSLRERLNEVEEVRSYTMDFADGIIVPLFGATRSAGSEHPTLPLLAEIRQSLGGDRQEDGVTKEAFEKLSKAYVAAHFDSVFIAKQDWPVNKSTLLGLASEHPPAAMLSEHSNDMQGPLFALFDRRWEAGKGPTSFAKWKETKYTPHKEGQHTIKKKSDDTLDDSGFYQVVDYDLHYAPSLVIGRDRQPWCTERFEYNRAACIYQMYLQGAKKWVLPDSWAYTVEETNKHAPKERKNEADKLRSAIQSRLYTKYFSEACMHYGRAFLSNDLWESERAQHLRYSCARVLNSYGIGLSAEEEAAKERQEQASKKKKKKKQK